MSVRLFCEALVAPSVRAAMSNPWPPARMPTRVRDAGADLTQSHGSLPPVARSSETHHRHGAGPAAGAGMSLALACDIRIASDTGKIITAFAKVGLSGDFGGSWFLTQLVGPAKARELYFLADAVGAEEALALGLFNRVVPDDKLEEETAALASRLANGPTVTLGYMKKNLDAAIRSLWRNAWT